MTDRTERATSAVHPVPATGPRLEAGKRVKRGVPAEIGEVAGAATLDLIRASDILGGGQESCAFCGHTYWKLIKALSRDESHAGVQYMCGHCGARGPIAALKDWCIAAVGYGYTRSPGPIMKKSVSKSGPIENLQLSDVAIKCLAQVGIRTVADLLTWSEIDLLTTQFVGKKVVNEVRWKLQDFDACFRRCDGQVTR